MTRWVNLRGAAHIAGIVAVAAVLASVTALRAGAQAGASSGQKQMTFAKDVEPILQEMDKRMPWRRQRRSDNQRP